ncbi:MAG: hypothetical protein ABIR87_06780 [Sphingomicrobium sp.]
MTSNPLLIVGIMVLFGAAMNFLRFWTFIQGSGANRRARMSRINEGDSHLSFDERIAERMRELQQEQAASAPPSPPTSGPTGATRGFGRRQA